ncbi:hypothetical protein [Actinokineospora globicatena]|uniref:hypothetical protein n=1 Tax=Actinokineospora globicatena TaxID=103729 RepID=UPI0020A3105E|nr:hypothetical protein [Actinokineospora globicatena]MCP2302523.1 hypothetical protein [Actinokineospora globicatena]GLW75790.1 hypothetical protein Aglo01_02720 [Actinokineospora globicatena]GLW82630.1 hypothetical protein Aglo02_02710 [Actinokineospora globicatena]
MTTTGVEATAHPGGILKSLSITESALRHPDLATLILDAVDQATIQANHRVQHLLGTIDPALLGLPTPPTTDDTTPKTWRTQ